MVLCHVVIRPTSLYFKEGPLIICIMSSRQRLPLQTEWCCSPSSSVAVTLIGLDFQSGTGTQGLQINQYQYSQGRAKSSLATPLENGLWILALAG